MPLTSKTRPFAVITGAASGIGYELAKQFAEHDFDLLIASEDAGVAEAKTALLDLGSHHVDALRIDLASYEGIEKLYAALTASSRPVDALAIDAGGGVRGDFASETELTDELKLLQLNVLSSVHLTKRIVRDMARRGKGRILFTSSVAAEPGPKLAVDAASKAFLQSFAESLREELRDSGVAVSSLMPGEKDDATAFAKRGFDALMSSKDQLKTQRSRPEGEPSSSNRL